MIKRLSPHVSNRIAAGEVVERPAAVVKELIENSLDAGATQIDIEIEDAGKSLIKITDNGKGILIDDLPLLFERHATSKIDDIDDIYAISSLGFRGEALASIASVSRVELISKTAASTTGYRVFYEQGKLTKPSNYGSSSGTCFMVRDLFYNTPVRYKFLKADKTETTTIIDIVNKLIMSRPDVKFSFKIDGKHHYSTDGKNLLINTIFTIFGREIVDHLLPISAESKVQNFKLSGYISDNHYVRGNRRYQYIFINNRFVISEELQNAINDAYHMLITIGKFPVFFIKIDIPFDAVDVNIHPSKTEIKFKSPQAIQAFVKNAAKDVLDEFSLVPQTKLTEPDKKQSIPVDPNQKINKFFDKYKNNTELYITNSPSDDSQVRASQDIELPATLVAESIDIYDQPVDMDCIDEAIDLFKDDTIEFEQRESVKGEQLLINHQISYKTTLYDNLTIMGVLFDTYIMCQREDSAFIIDQHAAHERVLYEKFRLAFERSEVASQVLLEPIIYECDPKTHQLIKHSISDIKRMGIDIEPFGKDAWVIRAVPLVHNVVFNHSSIIEILDSFENFTKHSLREVFDERLIKKSCKSAIKGHDKMTSQQLYTLFDLLKTYDNPYTCPHGRPIIIELTEYELEKKFKRIQ